MRIKKFVEIECHYCYKKHLKELKEYTRKLKEENPKFYCNNKCCYKDNPVLIERANWTKNNPTEAIKIINTGDRRYREKDELSPFRYIYNKILSRIKTKITKKTGNLECNLTVEDLKLQFDKQGGICPYTGLKMELTGQRETKITQASLDRIDSNKGYIIGNIEFVCLGVNYAKNGFSKEITLDFFKNINKSN